MSNEEKQKEIEKVLLELAKVDSDVESDDIIKKFNLIYSDDFRHEYNKLFAFIIKISKKEKTYSLDTLLSKLESIKEKISENDNSNNRIVKAFNKLYDHLSLEISRYKQYNSRFELNDSELKKNEKSINKISKKIYEFEKRFNYDKDSIDEIKNQLITILGIFASIVLTFAGGISFTISAFNSIADVGIKNVVALSLILGIIFTIVIYLLTYVIAKVNNIQLKSYWICVVFIIMAIIALALIA